MKVLIVGYPLDQTSRDLRVSIYMGKLSHYISRMSEVELHAITLGDKNGHFKEGDVVIHVVNKRLLFAPPYLLWLLKQKIEKINPDIVHATGTFPYTTSLALVRNKYPVILSVLGLSSADIKFQTSPIRVLRKMLISNPNEKYVTSRIPDIIAESSYNKYAISKMTDSKIYVVPDGIEFEQIQQIQPHPNQKPDIFYIGRLAEIKGVDILINSLQLVIKAMPDVTLYIGSSGPQEGKLKKLVKKLGLEHNVKFLGFIPEEEKFQYYKACKVVVVPSRWDFSPMTIYEAMACGKPVIASNVTNSDILEDGVTGLLFESEHVEDLVDTIVKLLEDDELRERMGKTALERARECDWSKIAEKTVEVYREAIADFHERKAKNS